jgi:ketosteroid isomerase-like protein
VTVAVFATAAALLLAACGDGDDGGGEPAGGAETTAAPEPAPPGALTPDGRAVRQTIAGYLKAVAEGDGDAACAFLTDNAKRVVVEGPGSRAETCEAVVAETARAYSPAEKAKLRNLPQEAVEVTVRGATATVHVEGRPRTTRLIKRGGRWLIDDYGPPPAGAEEQPEVDEVPFDEVEEELKQALDRRYDDYRYECPSTAPRMKVGEKRNCEVTGDGKTGTAELELGPEALLQIRLDVGGRVSFSQSQVEP